ncbi:MAG: TonB-dependent receptor [Gammaproteobacteria bacterium]
MRIAAMSRWTMTTMLALGAWTSHAAADLGAQYRLNVPAQSVFEALKTFAAQTNLQVVYFSEVGEGAASAGAVGTLRADEALKQLLGGTGLTFQFLNERTVAIRKAGGVRGEEKGARTTDAELNNGEQLASPDSSRGSMQERRRLAQSSQPQRESSSSEEKAPPKSRSGAEARAQLEEVVVTGTNIRGVPPIGSAVTSVTRDDIERAGFRDIAEAIRSLPGNFGGAGNPEARVSGNTYDYASSVNRTYASSANLLGLGSGATLTLLNGRRLPVSGEGLAVDISLIPIAAIDRIDVVADGASAIYGADAVAGVVNIITRSDYDGVEARARYGGAKDGLDTRIGSLMAGGSLGDLSGVVGVDYLNQSDLSAADRDRSQLVQLPRALVQSSERTSFFASGKYELSPDLKVYANGLYMDRSGSTVSSTANVTTFQPIHVFQYATAAGLTARIGGTWILDAGGTLNGNGQNTPTHSIYKATGLPSSEGVNQTRNELRTIGARASGEALQMPGGAVSAAAGVDYREESLSSRTRPGIGSSRTVKSLYGEIGIPLIGPEQHVPAMEELRMSLAERRDDYSDVGAVSVPKVGLRWRIDSSFDLHGTYSKSFRAPTPYESSIQYYVSGTQVQDASGPLRALYIAGTGRPLAPERAENVNAGFSYDPRWLEGLHLSIDGYRIDYTNRIASPDPTYIYQLDIRNAPAQLIQKNPSQEYIDELVRGNLLTNSPFPVSTAQVIVDVRTTNIASTLIKGAQLAAAYRTALASGSLNLSYDLAYISNYRYQLLPGGPAITRVGTIYSPPRWRSRAGAVWMKSGFTGALYWDFVDSSIDNRIASGSLPIDSWNTFDASATYDFGSRPNGVLDGVRAVFSVTNLLDTQPPAVAPLGSTYAGWDASNASIVGRFVSLEIIKKW